MMKVQLADLIADELVSGSWRLFYANKYRASIRFISATM